MILRTKTRKMDALLFLQRFFFLTIIRTECTCPRVCTLHNTIWHKFHSEIENANKIVQRFLGCNRNSPRCWRLCSRLVAYFIEFKCCPENSFVYCIFIILQSTRCIFPYRLIRLNAYKHMYGHNCNYSIDQESRMCRVKLDILFFYKILINFSVDIM